MRLAELIQRSHEWEAERHITNGHWGADRTQRELNEYREEDDYYQKLVEAADVYITLGGSIGALLEALNFTYEDFEQIVAAKFEVNDQKYPVEVFELLDQDQAQAICRVGWEMKNGT